MLKFCASRFGAIGRWCSEFVGLFVESSEFEQVLYRGSQQVDHAYERVIVSISSGSAFGCLEDAIECFDPGIVVA